MNDRAIFHYQEYQDVKIYYCLHLYYLHFIKKNKPVMGNNHISIKRVIWKLQYQANMYFIS